MTFFRLRDDKSDYDLYETPPVDFIPDSDIGFYATQYDANDLATCYANGFFPWPSPSHPVIPFYCPRKRFVLRPADLHVSHSLRRTIAKRTFTIHCDTAFCDVIVQCATTARRHEAGTWITNDYIDAFCDLHDRGIAHSVEAYDDDGTLCGGFYGTCMGRIFGGESMFTRISDSAKVAFVHFVQRARFRLPTHRLPRLHAKHETLRRHHDASQRLPASTRHIPRRSRRPRYVEVLIFFLFFFLLRGYCASRNTPAPPPMCSLRCAHTAA